MTQRGVDPWAKREVAPWAMRNAVRSGAPMDAGTPVGATESEIGRAGVRGRDHLFAWELVVDDALVIAAAEDGVRHIRRICEVLRSDPEALAAFWLYWCLTRPTLGQDTSMVRASCATLAYLRDRYPELAAGWVIVIDGG